MFHVSTRFWHVFFIPLIPMGTYLLVKGEEDSWGNPGGIKIPFSYKSLLLAWLRAATFITALITGGWLVVIDMMNSGGNQIPAVICAASLFMCILLSFGKPFRRASYTRAKELGAILDLTPRGYVALDLACRRISKSEAEELMAPLIVLEEQELAMAEQELAREKQERRASLNASFNTEAAQRCKAGMKSSRLRRKLGD